MKTTFFWLIKRIHFSNPTNLSVVRIYDYWIWGKKQTIKRISATKEDHDTDSITLSDIIHRTSSRQKVIKFLIGEVVTSTCWSCKEERSLFIHNNETGEGGTKSRLRWFWSVLNDKVCKWIIITKKILIEKCKIRKNFYFVLRLVLLLNFPKHLYFDWQYYILSSVLKDVAQILRIKIDNAVNIILL